MKTLFSLLFLLYSGNISSNSLDTVIREYIVQLNKSSTKLSYNCIDSEVALEKYYKGIFHYGDIGYKFVIADLDNDGDDDYVVDYSASNCWNGIGALNYLCNFFIVKNDSGNYYVDVALTKKLKEEFIDYVTKKHGRPIGEEKYSPESFVKGVRFKGVKDGKLYATYAVTTDKNLALFQNFKGIYKWKLF